MSGKTYDLIIIGGGPCGLACGIEAHKAGLNYLIIEKGSIAESIRRYPIHMNFFSTARNIEIGNIPFAAAKAKANRSEALKYYRLVAEHYQLKIQLFTTVEQIQKSGDIFNVQTDKNQFYTSKNVVFATGYFDCPRQLNIPGERLPHVSKYYDEPYKYAMSKVIIVGGGNSAVEAALDLYHNGVEVTMIIRKEDFKPTAKYWLIPDLRNRVKDGKIKVRFNSEVKRIDKGKIWILENGKADEQVIPADFVLLLVGYTPDSKFLAASGIELNPENLVPKFDTETFETNVPGLYVAGTVVCGIRTEKVFIENGRHDGAKIVKHILGNERN